MARLLTVILVLVVLINSQLAAQNLVPNSGFEEKKECQQTIIEAAKFVSWERGDNNTTPDYYHRDCPRFGVPANPAGVTKAKAGDAYAGLVCYSNEKVYREFIRVQLTEPLQKGMEYEVSFYYYLADISEYAVSDLGFILQKSKHLYDYFASQFYKKNKEEKEEKIYQDERTWTKYKSLYVAKGGEQYLMIGNLDSDALFDAKQVVPIKKIESGSFSYYYLDDVIVKPTGNKVEETVEKAFENKAKVKLENIYFETGKSDLLPESFQQLDLLVSLMQKNATAKLVVTGHTDNTGTDAINKSLSAARAKAVVNYLVSKGIAIERLESEGKGSSDPVASNNSDEGRQKNRRVEITVK